jgi:hypothetical protein
MVLKVFRTRMLVCDKSFTQKLPNNLPHGMEGLVGLAYVNLCPGVSVAQSSSDAWT